MPGFLDGDKDRAPADKAFAIALANLLIAGIAMALFGFSEATRDELGDRLVDSIWATGYIWVAGPTILVAFLTCFGTLPSSLLKEIKARFVGRGAKPDGWIACYETWWDSQFLRPAGGTSDQAAPDLRLPRFLLVMITAGTYWSVLVLTQATGGAAKSPFGQLPVGMILLAPIIMTTFKAKVSNLLLGVIYIGTLFLVPRWLEVLPFCTLIDRPIDELTHGWAFAVPAVSLTLGSLGFPLLAAAFQRGRTAATTSPPAPPPPQSDKGSHASAP